MNLLDKVAARVAIRIVRQGAVYNLTRSGFEMVGGDRTPITRKRAWELVNKVARKTVAGFLNDAAIQYQWPGEKLWHWILEHKEVIIAAIKLLLTLILMFI